VTHEPSVEQAHDLMDIHWGLLASIGTRLNNNGISLSFLKEEGTGFSRSNRPGYGMVTVCFCCTISVTDSPKTVPR
jgi:hypothetical protein